MHKLGIHISNIKIKIVASFTYFSRLCFPLFFQILKLIERIHCNHMVGLKYAEIQLINVLGIPKAYITQIICDDQNLIGFLYWLRLWP